MTITTSKFAPELDWESIRFTFISGRMSASEHAATHGVTIASMRQRIARGKWLKERQILSRNVAIFARETITKTKGQELAEFDSADAKMSRALRATAANMLTRANQPGAKPLTPNDARTIASLAEMAQKIGRIALGAATSNVGVGGIEGAPPVMVATMSSEAVEKAMLAYLHEY